MFVDEPTSNIAFVDNENTRHLETISQFGAIAIAFHDDRLETPDPGTETVQLAITAFYQTESSVILAHRVADMLSAV